MLDFTRGIPKKGPKGTFGGGRSCWILMGEIGGGGFLTLGDFIRIKKRFLEK